MNYSYLSQEQRAQMLLERLASMEAEHYQHEINRRIGLSLSEHPNPAQRQEAERMVAEAEAAQAVIDLAYATAQAELAALEATVSRLPLEGSGPQAAAGS